MPAYARTLTTTISLITPYNSRRQTLVIQNIGTDTVFVSENPVNVANDGLRIGVGGSVSLIGRDGDEPSLPLYGVANTGSQAIRVTERYGQAEVVVP